MLEKYDPNIMHLADIIISEGTSPKAFAELVSNQREIYNHYFYIKGIFRNLTRNELVKTGQLEKIRIHYNFLSNYIHPGMANIDIWRNLKNSNVSRSDGYDEETFSELLFLYVSKLMHLYVKVYVSHYRTSDKNYEWLRYEKLVNELDLLSRDLWFFDNNPTEFDIKRSKQKREYLKITNKTTTTDQSVGVLYYDNPLERQQAMRKSASSSSS